MRDSLRTWFNHNTGIALAALAFALFVTACLTGMLVETLNKPTQVSEQAIKDNTEAVTKDDRDTRRKLDKLTSQVESLQALTTRTANKPSDFAGTWTSNNFKLVIRKDGTGTFEVGKYYELCNVPATACMGSKVKREFSGTAKLNMSKFGQMMVFLKKTKEAKNVSPTTGVFPFANFWISKTSDNRMIILVGSQTGKVIYSGCNTKITAGLPFGCP